MLCEAVSARQIPAPVVNRERPFLGSGAITTGALGASIGALLSENAVVADEAMTTGRGFFAPTEAAAPHDWLSNMGGSIGFGPPLATGAAVACPDRKVVGLQADGSAMYTVQALWTQAREGFDVTTVLFSNRAYHILKGELASVGAGNPGRKALDMLDLGDPDIDWVGLAKSLGVPGPASPTWTASTAALPRAWRRRAPISSRSFSRSRSTVRRKSRLLRPVCGQTGRSAVPTGAPKIIHFAIPWWPLLTQLNRYRCRLRAAALGLLTPSRRPS